MCAEVHIYLNLSPCIIAVIIIRVILNLLIKLTLCCIDFSFLIQVIGPETSRHSLNQSDSKLKKNRELSLTLSRVFSLVFVLFFSLFVLIDSIYCDISSHLIGRCDFSDIDFTTLNRNMLYHHHQYQDYYHDYYLYYRRTTQVTYSSFLIRPIHRVLCTAKFL